MLRVLSYIQKNLVWTIPAAMVLGLVFGYLFDASGLKQFIIPVTFIMVYPMMVTLNVKTVFKGRDYKLQLVTQLINFILIPLVAFVIGRLFLSGADPKYALWAVGLFLIGVLPTSGMTISWTGFAKGHKEAAIKMVVFGLIIGSLAAPVYTKVIMGATIEVDMLHMFKQIAIFVFLPLAAGLLTQFYGTRKYGAREWNQRIKPKFPPFSAAGVVLIAFLAMSLKARHIIAHPGDILTIMIPLVIFYLVSYVFLTLTGRFLFKREEAIAMVFGVVMRDLSIALAIAMTAFGKEGLTIALLISLAYIVQIQSAAWYVRFINFMFGEPAPETAQPVSGRPAQVPAAVDDFPDEIPLTATIRKILFATDLSDAARYAVTYACSIGNQYDAEVHALTVVPDVLDEYASGTGVTLSGTLDRHTREDYNRNNIEAAKKAIKDRMRITSQKILARIPHCPLSENRTIVTAGDPVTEIVRIAEKDHFDLIIMGAHGHAELTEMFLGSTATGVMLRSSVPVLIARPPR